jgi:adenylate kinase
MKKERLGFNLILLGQIAAGKETQAAILMDKYNLKPVESGKHWRKLSKAKTPEGELLRKTTSKGFPAPVSLMKKFLISELGKKPKNRDLIFIGNPRLKPEAQLLKKLLHERKEQFFALYISLPDKEIYRRSFARKEGDAHSIYSMLDVKHIIVNRIKYHKEQVSKTVTYLDSLGKMKKINGNQSVEKVREDIQKAIDGFKKKLS